MKRFYSFVLAALLLASAPPVSHGVAEAGLMPMFGTITQRKVVNQTSTSNYVDRSREIARCSVATAGLSCSINKTSSATRTIDVALGISRGSVASSLGISDSTTVAVSVTCSSGALKKGQSLVAHSMGTRYTYKINKTVARSGVVLSSETSGWLYAFNPSSSGISCRVA